MWAPKSRDGVRLRREAAILSRWPHEGSGDAPSFPKSAGHPEGEGKSATEATFWDRVKQEMSSLLAA